MLNVSLISLFIIGRYWNSTKRQLLVGQKPGKWVPAQNTDWQRYSWGSPVCQEYNLRSSYESHGFITFGYH